MGIVRIKRSINQNSIPSGLLAGELALNIPDRKLYTIDKMNAVQFLNFTSDAEKIASGPIADALNAKVQAFNAKRGSSLSLAPVTSNTFPANSVVWVDSALNIQSFGGKGDGITDNANALLLALSFLPAKGGCIYFPLGKYVFNSNILFSLLNANQSITIVGDGQNNTELCWPNSDAMTFTMKDATTTLHMRDIAITTSAAITRVGVKLVVTNDNVNAALGEYTDFTRVTFRGSDGYALNYGWSRCVVLDNVSNVNIDGSSFIGNGASLGYGIVVSGRNDNSLAVVFNFEKSTWVHLEVGIQYGSYVQGMTISQDNFTAVTNPILVPPNALGILSQLTIVASQFAANGGQNGAAINIQTGVNPLIIADNLFLSNGTGTQINLLVHSFTSISGNALFSPTPNANSAISLGSGSSHSKINDNVIFGFELGIGIPNTTSNLSVTNNILGGCIATITYTSTAANNNYITGNSGFQPQAPSPQILGSSPWTYASPGIPVTIYVSAGSVSQVSIDDIVISNSNLGSYILEPNQKIQIAYSSTPSVLIATR